MTDLHRDRPRFPPTGIPPTGIPGAPAFASTHEEDAHWIQIIRRSKSPLEIEAAYERLVSKHWRGVTVLAFGRLGDLREAEDVAQESFVRAWRSLHRLKEPTAFLGWLLRIASNVATDHLRVRRSTVSLETLGDVATARPNFQERVERGEEVEAVLDVMEALPEREREVIVLKYLREMDGRSMSDYLGEPEGTVRNRLFRALAKVRQLVGDARLGSAAARGGEQN